MPDEIISREERAALRIGRGIMKTMVPAENSIDAAIAGTSNLLATVAAGRVQSGVGVDVGAHAMTAIWRGIGALLTARRHIVNGHSELAEIRDALGFDGEEFGCSASKGGGKASGIAAA